MENKESFEEVEYKKRIQKPVGIYILTIIVFIVLGVLQFTTYWIEFQKMNEDLPFIMVFIPLFLCGFTALSANWAAIGDNLSRIVLLVFASLNVLWWAFLVIVANAYDNSKQLAFLYLTTTLIRPVIVLICCWWYFTKKDVVAFYKQSTKN